MGEPDSHLGAFLNSFSENNTINHIIYVISYNITAVFTEYFILGDIVVPASTF